MSVQLRLSIDSDLRHIAGTYLGRYFLGKRVVVVCVHYFKNHELKCYCTDDRVMHDNPPSKEEKAIIHHVILVLPDLILLFVLLLLEVLLLLDILVFSRCLGLAGHLGFGPLKSP